MPKRTKLVLASRTPRAAFFWPKGQNRGHLGMGLHRGTARAAYFWSKMPPKKPDIFDFWHISCWTWWTSRHPKQGRFWGFWCYHPMHPSEACQNSAPAHVPHHQMQRVICGGFQGMFWKCPVECLKHRTESLLLRSFPSFPYATPFSGGLCRALLTKRTPRAAFFMSEPISSV